MEQYSDKSKKLIIKILKRLIDQGAETYSLDWIMRFIAEKNIFSDEELDEIEDIIFGDR